MLPLPLLLPLLLVRLRLLLAIKRGVRPGPSCEHRFRVIYDRECASARAGCKFVNIRRVPAVHV